MPTRVAVETMRVWNDERLSLLWFFSQTAEIISRNSRTGSRRVRRVKNTPAMSSNTTISEIPTPPAMGSTNKSPQRKR